MATYKLTISGSGWTQTYAALYYNTVDQKFYAETACTTLVEKLPKPTRECYQYMGGFKTNAVTGVQVIDADGNFLDELKSYMTQARTIYTCGTVISYKYTLSPNSGVATLYAFVKAGETGASRYYADDQLTQPITNFPYTTRSSYIFIGYYSATTGSTVWTDADGLPNATFNARTAAATTLYARWRAPRTITTSYSGWTGADANLYVDELHKKVFADSALTQEKSSTAVPYKSGYAFDGYTLNSEASSTQLIDGNGAFLQALYDNATSNRTIYAQGHRISWLLTIDDNGGTGGSGSMYQRIGVAGTFYADADCTVVKPSLLVPTKTGHRFMGYWSAASGGTQYTTNTGAYTADMLATVFDGDTTLPAQWLAPTKVTIDSTNWTGATAAVWFDTTTGNFYADANMTQVITACAVPTRQRYEFTGVYTASSGGTQLVASSGTFLPAFYTFVTTAPVTVYVQGHCLVGLVTLACDGGTCPTAALYFDTADATPRAYYTDMACTAAVSNVGTTTKTGHTFHGFYSAAAGGTQYIGIDGEILPALRTAALGGETTATARWTVNTYTLTFDYNKGTGATASKQVTFGQPIGTLPTATRTNATFVRWDIDGAAITDATVWSIGSDKTAKAIWDTPFGRVTDWFNLANANMKVVSSESGDNKQRICCANATISGSTQTNAGRYSSGVNAIGGVWRNPKVVYEVTGDMTLALNLGTAFAKSGTTISGYMITSVEVVTQIGKFPQVTVVGTANEGANAINLFAVSIPLLARARAQNLHNAISGGGQLQNCKLVASCTPIVLAENMFPCASDVVEGKLVVTGALYAPSGEAAPTAANGYTSIGEPKNCGSKEYMQWQITAQKEIV